MSGREPGGEWRQVIEALTGLRAELAARFDAIDARFDAIDGRFDAIDGRFEAIDGRFARIDDAFAVLRRDLSEKFERIDDQLTALRDDFSVMLARVERVSDGLRGNETELRSLVRVLRRQEAHGDALRHDVDELKRRAAG